MTQFTNNDVSSGAIVYASDHNTQGSLLAAVLNGGIENENISASAAIATSKLASDGFLAAWSSWTPTLTNISGGTLTYAKYIQTGKTVRFRFAYTLAGAGVSGAAQFTLPVTMATGYAASHVIGIASCIDTGTNTYPAYTFVVDTSTVRIAIINAAGTYSVFANTSSTAPFTWGNTDVLYAEGQYEAA